MGIRDFGFNSEKYLYLLESYVVTLIVIGSICLVALLLFVVLVVMTQKHRTDKRRRLESSLISANSV